MDGGGGAEGKRRKGLEGKGEKYGALCTASCFCWLHDGQLSLSCKSSVAINLSGALRLCAETTATLPHRRPSTVDRRPSSDRLLSCKQARHRVSYISRRNKKSSAQSLKLSVQRNETETKQFQNSLETVLSRFVSVSFRCADSLRARRIQSLYNRNPAFAKKIALGRHSYRFSSVGRAPTSATEPSVQLDLEFGTICRRTSDSRTCHTAISDSR